MRDKLESFEKGILAKSTPESTKSKENSVSQGSDDGATASLSNSSDIFSSGDNPPSASQNNYCQTVKLMELNTAIAEANLAFTNYMISEFILNSYKAVALSNSTPQSISDFVNNVIKTCRLQKIAVMENRKGKSMNLLGLDDSCFEIKHELSSTEQSQLKIKVFEELKQKTEEFQNKRQSIREIFGNLGHGRSLYEQEIPCQVKLERFYTLYNTLNCRLGDLVDLVEGCGDTMNDLFKLNRSNQCKQMQMDAQSMAITKDKVKQLKVASSMLQEKIKLLLSKNEYIKNDLNTKGDELKQKINSLQKQLNEMKGSLKKYSEKERNSSEFRELVKEYGATLRIFQHKQDTLRTIKSRPNSSPGSCSELK